MTGPVTEERSLASEDLAPSAVAVARAVPVAAPTAPFWPCVVALAPTDIVALPLAEGAT